MSEPTQPSSGAASPAPPPPPAAAATAAHASPAPPAPDASEAGEDGARGEEHPPGSDISIDDLLKEADELVGRRRTADADQEGEPSVTPVAETEDAQVVAELQSEIDASLEQKRAANPEKEDTRPAAPAAVPPAPEASEAVEAEQSEAPAAALAPTEPVAEGPAEPTAEAEAEVAAPVAEQPQAPAEAEAPDVDADAEFAAPEAVLAQAATDQAGEADGDGVEALDAELAARAKAALDAEEDDAPAGGAAPAPVKPAASAPPARSGTTSEAPAAKAAQAAPEEPRPRVMARARSLVHAAGERAVASYMRLGDGHRKIIAWSAWGTLVQAAVIWGWLLFLRSPHIPEPGHAPAAQASAEAHKPAADHGDKGHH